MWDDIDINGQYDMLISKLTASGSRNSFKTLVIIYGTSAKVTST